MGRKPEMEKPQMVSTYKGSVNCNKLPVNHEALLSPAVTTLPIITIAG